MNDPTFLYQNTRSIKNKIHLIEALTEEYNLAALCLTETWITKSKVDLLCLEGYTLASLFTRTNREGGGVCIFVKEQIHFIELEDVVDLSVEYIVELCAIEITSLNLILIVIYWPDGNRQVDLFNVQFEKLLKLLTTKYLKKNVIIGGDLNTDFLGKSTQAKTILNICKSYNFHQLINEPTRITPTSSTCLDVIFTNIDKQIVTINVHEFGISDHKGTSITLSKQNMNVKQTYYIEKRQFNIRNMSIFKEKLQCINWGIIITNKGNLNQNYNAFHEQLTNLLNCYIPKVKVTIKNKNKTWLTKGIKISCKNKRQLKILKSQANSDILNNYYKTYVKMLKTAVNVSKKNQYINRMKATKNISKTMWQIIKERTNKINKKIHHNIHLKTNNNKNTNLEEPHMVANTLNNYFVSVGSSHKKTKIPLGHPVIQKIENTMYLGPVTVSEINNILKVIKNKSSYGFDEFPPVLVKFCRDELIQPLTYLINQSFNEATFPEILKTTVVKPIPKKRNANEADQFRPIALLSTFSKIFEFAVASRLKSFCEKYNVFNESQHGFRKNRSTSTALYKFITDILEIIDNRNYAVGIMLDMSKAYDHVSHEILLTKLEGIGIRGLAYRWLASYLRNRQQVVQIEHYVPENNFLQNITSHKLNLERSIPQGSVLSCILFLIYINDVAKCINERCVMYADDISIVLQCSSSENLQDQINTTLGKLLDWLGDHNLELNIQKTKLMQFKPRQKIHLENKIKFQKSSLDFVNSATLLGIDLDSGLNWKAHTEKITARLSKFIYALYELKKCTDLKTAKTAYYAYANAWLTYGIIVWGNSTGANQLFILQKRCVRILMNITNEKSCRPHFVKLRMLTLASLYILEICKFLRKNLHLHTQARDFYTGERNLRHKDRLIAPFTKLQLVSSGPFHMSVKIYNQIPKHLKDIDKDLEFNRKLKEFLIFKCFYSLNEFFMC